ncbi:LacI family DNA-binding transcriptional regulator [Microbacterium sp. ARD32]|uniref:LacI family DNA-binding transcriptional regulator n=1 Tax=Microbacterium sp. ARD32 TaxID=2962577 RepID=UPI002881FD39|nr:LacI family DNA-binding transcriptional regulator [Microbacterium sp. ARD32]MDT0158436.1 LacI family DNA-binding transcriptional regulator [Microbacterium sp. ARD32]
MSTIADVAARAGVSKATASRALSGGGYVSAPTREKVRAAASELSYVAHSSATSLATGRSLSVGVIMPALDRWFFAELLAGIQAGLLASGQDLVLYGIRERTAERAQLFEEVLPRRRLDGIIAVGIQPSARELERLIRVESPLVSIGAYSEGTSAVSIDDAGAARIATEHLIDLGHRDIAFLGGTADAATHAFGDERRLAGYRQAMMAAGLAAFVRHADGEPTMPGGYEAAVRMLGDRQSRPTALVAVCDEAAIGAVVGARRLGLSVPAELSIVGIDDHEHAEMFALTTVRQQPRAQGLAAVEVLRRRMDAPDAAPERQVLPSELVVRASTAAPR